MVRDAVELFFMPLVWVLRFIGSTFIDIGYWMNLRSQNLRWRICHHNWGRGKLGRSCSKCFKVEWFKP